MNKRDEAVLAAVSRARVGPSGWARGNCPWCEAKTGKPDKKQGLGLQVASGKWHCFKCQSAGMLGEIPSDLASHAPKARDPEAPQAMVAPAEFIPLFEEPGLSSAGAAPARAYWESRGFTPKLARRARVSVCLRRPSDPDATNFSGRIIIPIYASDEQTLVGWSARDFTGKKDRKYLYPSGMTRVLYNHAALLKDTDEPAILVEGVLDALALWPRGVACLGKPSHEQRAALLESKRPIAVCLDGDAWREGMALAFWLRLGGAAAGFVKLPPERDPATFPRPELLEMARASIGV